MQNNIVNNSSSLCRWFFLPNGDIFIEGMKINFRTVTLEDAEFVYNLRINENKAKYLSKITGKVEDQRKWIGEYKKREKDGKEYYFVICLKDDKNIGLVRIYDFQGDSFSWGSWLLSDDAPKTVALESAMIIYEFGFYGLSFKMSHFDVRKDNYRVVNFHKKFGAKIIKENDLDIFFIFTKDDYEKVREKFAVYL